MDEWQQRQLQQARRDGTTPASQPASQHQTSNFTSQNSNDALSSTSLTAPYHSPPLDPFALRPSSLLSLPTYIYIYIHTYIHTYTHNHKPTHHTTPHHTTTKHESGRRSVSPNTHPPTQPRHNTPRHATAPQKKKGKKKKKKNPAVSRKGKRSTTDTRAGACVCAYTSQGTSHESDERGGKRWACGMVCDLWLRGCVGALVCRWSVGVGLGG
ncbi:uncharacterized protein IWZ02DRAFT_106062 [Phyllosticta citriasiana]|uniref:uncharacterized protein n=1 Tax=Phyllosticta citriasiana TaxID=595635 RepID=UPI0030FDEF3A